MLLPDSGLGGGVVLLVAALALQPPLQGVLRGIAGCTGGPVVHDGLIGRLYRRLDRRQLRSIDDDLVTRTWFRLTRRLHLAGVYNSYIKRLAYPNVVFVAGIF